MYVLGVGPNLEPVEYPLVERTAVHVHQSNRQLATRGDARDQIHPLIRLLGVADRRRIRAFQAPKVPGKRVADLLAVAKLIPSPRGFHQPPVRKDVEHPDRHAVTEDQQRNGDRKKMESKSIGCVLHLY